MACLPSLRARPPPARSTEPHHPARARSRVRAIARLDRIDRPLRGRQSTVPSRAAGRLQVEKDECRSCSSSVHCDPERHHGRTGRGSNGDFMGVRRRRGDIPIAAARVSSRMSGSAPDRRRLRLAAAVRSQLCRAPFGRTELPFSKALPRVLIALFRKVEFMLIVSIILIAHGENNSKASQRNR